MNGFSKEFAQVAIDNFKIIREKVDYTVTSNLDEQLAIAMHIHKMLMLGNIAYQIAALTDSTDINRILNP